MAKNELHEIVQYIVRQGVVAIKTNMGEQDMSLDYLAIFAKDAGEYAAIENILESLGDEIDKETSKTGRTFLLRELIQTPGGPLSALKIRKPDPTRPQRGAPDFSTAHFQELKEKFLSTSGTFTLMIRKEYELIELKGVDVLVYIPSKTLRERMKEKGETI